MLTKQEIAKALPPNLKSAVTDQLVDMVNNITQDQMAAENIRENFISFAHVMKEGRFKTEDYLNAFTIRQVSRCGEGQDFGTQAQGDC